MVFLFLIKENKEPSMCPLQGNWVIFAVTLWKSGSSLLYIEVLNVSDDVYMFFV